MTTDEKNNEGITAVWRNGGCSASYDSFVVGSGAVPRLNFCAEIPPLRQAAKRYVQPYWTQSSASAEKQIKKNATLNVMISPNNQTGKIKTKTND